MSPVRVPVSKDHGASVHQSEDSRAARAATGDQARKSDLPPCTALIGIVPRRSARTPCTPARLRRFNFLDMSGTRLWLSAFLCKDGWSLTALGPTRRSWGTSRVVSRSDFSRVWSRWSSPRTPNAASHTSKSARQSGHTQGHVWVDTFGTWRPRFRNQTNLAAEAGVAMVLRVAPQSG
jgi:hypothetical protein